MKRVTGIFSGLALTAVLALSVLGRTPENNPMANNYTQEKTSAHSAKNEKKKPAKKSKTKETNSTGTTKQSTHQKY